MNYPRQVFLVSLVLSLLLLQPRTALSDEISAELAMEAPFNPLLLINSSAGDIYIELFLNEAPNNVANFMAFAEGEIELVDPATNTRFKPRYFDGMRFHRVVPDFVIQAGSPANHPLGSAEETLRDEINADYLGLNLLPAMSEDGTFNALLNINDRADFEEQILNPLYRRLNINTQVDLLIRQSEVLEQLQQMSVKNVYENQGYRYRSSNPSHAVTRGVVALANTGPDGNGPEFFISLIDAEWLTGKHTVIGKVVEGMDVVDSIGEFAVHPLRFSRSSTVIYSVRRLN
jgi:cyclophilin family peptidyl-prolyl cis-trans isomerase